LRKHIENISEIYADLTALNGMFEELAGRVLDRVIDGRITDETIRQCPREFGDLQRSWSRSPNQVGSAGGTGFGSQTGVRMSRMIQTSFGYSDPKAFYVHEIPPPSLSGSTKGTQRYLAREWGFASLLAKEENLGGMRTAFHTPPTKWKFLEDPVNSHISDVQEELADEVEALIMYSFAERSALEGRTYHAIEEGYAGGIGASE
jgi:hypothetical protein